MAQICAALDTAHVCADGRSVNADAIAHFPGHQAACPKPQRFSDLPHGKSRHWGPPAQSKKRKATRHVIAQHPKQTSLVCRLTLQNTCPRQFGTAVHVRLVSLSAIFRYAQLWLPIDNDQEEQQPGTGESVGFLTQRVASRSRAFGEITSSIRYMEINSGVSFRHHSAAHQRTFGHHISLAKMWSNMWSKTRYIRGFFLRYQAAI